MTQLVNPFHELNNDNNPIEQNFSSIIAFSKQVLRNYIESDEKTLSSIYLQETLKNTPTKIWDALKKETQMPTNIHDYAQEWIQNPSPECMGMAELYAKFQLSIEDIEIIALLLGLAYDNTVNELYSLVLQNHTSKYQTIASLCRALSANQAEQQAHYAQRFLREKPLQKYALIKSCEPQPSLFDEKIVLDDSMIQFLKFPNMEIEQNITLFDENLSAFVHRFYEKIELNSLFLSEKCENAVLQMIRAKAFPTVLMGSQDCEKLRVAQACAYLMGQSLLCIEFASLLAMPENLLSKTLSRIFREAILGNDLIYFNAVELPETLQVTTQVILKNLLNTKQYLLGAETLPLWMAKLTSGLPFVQISLPNAEQRCGLWRQAFAKDKKMPDNDVIAAISRRYELSPTQIAHAAQEARRLSQISKRKRPDINDLDKACRAFFEHKLTQLADLVPPATFQSKDLILPPTERIKFDEVMLYATEHNTIYEDWGFAERFPYGRGLSILFYGPPGTGKTMAASIIASHLGLDLFRVDLARIVNAYIGETEKNLARVFDEAERGHVMLLFDEADALFTKRTTVKANADRYANLEVAYLLQRMENFDGVTILTTNAEINLDDALKRRLKYKIYFPMPDPDTRAKLYENLIPPATPKIPNIPFELLGKQFELSGGQIKQAVLRAAFYARRDKKCMGLEHLTDASLTECRELGMLMNDTFPIDLTNALRVEKGLPPLNEEEYKNLRKPMLRIEEEELLAKKNTSKN